MQRDIIFYKNYFLDFYLSLDSKIQEKIDYILNLIKTIEYVPIRFFKHIEGTDGLFEIRIKFNFNIFRIFCCFDIGKVVVLFNGFQKKGEKTPKNEIEKAIKIKNEYFLNKKSKK